MKKDFIPNYITLCNIFCGFISIIMTIQYKFLWSSIFIFIAVIADRYDGIVARKLGINSELGKELDSVCDVVSFGAAPAILVYAKASLITNSILFLVIVGIICGIYACCGAYRLARFNVTVMKNGYYQGVPITTCGCLIALIALFNNTGITIILILLTCVFAYLMVSSIKIKKI